MILLLVVRFAGELLLRVKELMQARSEHSDDCARLPQTARNCESETKAKQEPKYPLWIEHCTRRTKFRADQTDPYAKWTNLLQELRLMKNELENEKVSDHDCRSVGGDSFSVGGGSWSSSAMLRVRACKHARGGGKFHYHRCCYCGDSNGYGCGCGSGGGHLVGVGYGKRSRTVGVGYG
eukprot:4491878-Pleurochrysis_carterae.AAC.2